MFLKVPCSLNRESHKEGNTFSSECNFHWSAPENRIFLIRHRKSNNFLNIYYFSKPCKPNTCIMTRHCTQCNPSESTSEVLSSSCFFFFKVLYAAAAGLHSEHIGRLAQTIREILFVFLTIYYS